MKYTFAIDWLSLWCRCLDGTFCTEQLEDGVRRVGDWTYKKHERGTRQFHNLYDVKLGKNNIAVVASEEVNTTIGEHVCLVKFDNRLLYSSDLWKVVDCFLYDHNLAVLNITRLDLAADFNDFANGYEPPQFIADFASKKIRHKGRGNGDLHFTHFSKPDKLGFSIAQLIYTGLSFGSHDSDVRAYMYNKTFELMTVKDKPYIRELWVRGGLDITRDVWRLEISIKSKGMRFRDKETGDKIRIKETTCKDSAELLKIYHTFVRKYFFFLKNRPFITNISREPMIPLFADSPYYDHGVIRDLSCSNRTERILIKQLWQLAEKYRGDGMHQDEGITRTMAYDLAKGCDLEGWLMNKQSSWETPDRK